MNNNPFTYYYRLPPSALNVHLTRVHASGRGLSFNTKKDEVRYRLLVDSTFTALGESYTALKALFDTDPCDEIEFVIKYKDSEVWVGQLNLKKANWFPDLCKVVFKVDVKDGETCLRSNWEEEENIFQYGSEVQAETFFGTLTEVTCGPVNQATPVQINGFFELNVSSCLADLDAYAGKRLYIEEINPTSYDHYATWVTEQAVVACSGGVPVSPPGDGWVLLIDDCAGSGNATWGRKPQVTYEGEVSGASGKYWDNTYSVVGSEASTYSNGRLFSDIIEGLVSGCSLTVKSDFFGINADATAPSNSAYTASSAIQDIVVYQKSDIIFPDKSDESTLAYITLKDLLEWVKKIFQVYWRVEDGGETLRIEHISYFEGDNGTDLTLAASKAVAKKNGFSFDNDKITPREKFTWMDETTDADFRGLNIIYPPGCADAEQEGSVISVNQIFTDLGTINKEPGKVQETGLFFLAVDEISGSYYMNREAGEISGEIKPNGHLAWANLHENYHTWGRPFPSGNLNNQDITFNSYSRSRRQESLAVPFSVTDFFNLDFTEKLRTEIGWGEVDSVVYYANSCLAIIELLHDD